MLSPLVVQEFSWSLNFFHAAAQMQKLQNPHLVGGGKNFSFQNSDIAEESSSFHVPPEISEVACSGTPNLLVLSTKCIKCQYPQGVFRLQQKALPGKKSTFQHEKYYMNL